MTDAEFLEQLDAVNKAKANGESLEVDSIESFISWVEKKFAWLDKINERMPYGNKFVLYFRGEDDNSYILEPSIYRQGRIINEHKFFNEAIDRCPEDFDRCETTFEKLVKMQHYGVPTRLLDITENPLIALYFATLKNKKSTSGKIYCFYISEKAIKYPSDSNTALLANIATLDSKVFYEGAFHTKTHKSSKKFEEYAKEKDHEKRRKLYDEFFEESKSNVVIQELILKSIKDSGYNPSEYSLIEMAQCVCVKPKMMNRRISNQSSSFLLFGFLCDKNYVLPLNKINDNFDLLKLLFLNPYCEQTKTTENSIIDKLPLEDEVKEKLKDINDLSLLHFASDKRKNLSFEITHAQSKLITNIISECYFLFLNAHSLQTTSRCISEIKNYLFDFMFLSNTINFVWRTYPLIFCESIDVNKDAKDKLKTSLFQKGITDDFIYPELEDVAPVLCRKFNHPQPIVVEMIGNDLVVVHLSKKALGTAKLKLGDVILDYKSVEAFWQQFSITGQKEIKIRRLKRAKDLRTSDEVYYEHEFCKNISLDETHYETHILTISEHEISSLDNPLVANYSDV